VQLIAHLKTLSFSSSFSSPSSTINFIFLSSAKYGTLPLPSSSDDYLPTSTPILSSYHSVCSLAYPGCRISVVGGVKEAMVVARGKEGEGGSILVTGHMVLVGEVLEVFGEEGVLEGL
jgi:hypothetical protein